MRMQHIAYGVGIMVVIIVIRMFFFEICLVPSASMEPTILPNEIVLYSKTPYGAVCPRRLSEIPLINVFTWIAPLRKADEMSDWGNYRIGGYKRPKVNDVVVFRAMEEENKLMVKRIRKIYPKGTIVSISSTLGDSVRELIRRDHADIVCRQDKVYINGIQTKEYVLSQDFFDVRGDNTKASQDSRYYGLVPAEAIMGRMSLVIYSWNSNSYWPLNIRWNRLFKSI